MAPSLGKASGGGGPGNTQQDHNPAVQTSPIGGQPVAQGVPIDLEPRSKLLPDKDELQKPSWQNQQGMNKGQGPVK